jgi:flagellar biosynthetic protein FliQ
MTDSTVIQIGRDALATMLLLMAPPLIVALVVGVLISIVQAATQIQEMTLSFVPKLLAVFLTLVIFGPWMTATFLAFAHRLFSGFPDFVR